MAAASHKVRFKGVVVGQLTAAEIAERLRAGEMSLTHAVEHRGRWLTVRQFLREAEPALAPPPPGASDSLFGRLTRRISHAEHPAPPPPPGASLVGDAIERRVREGYLWCGLTFLLPIALGLPIWLLCSQWGARATQVSTYLILAILIGDGYAAWRAHRSAEGLEREGLEDVGRSLRQLSMALAAASACFWITVTLLWLTR